MQTMTAPAFPVTINFTWTEPDVIPPRCRNPRDVDHPGQQHTVYVPMVNGDAAPVAFRTPETFSDDGETKDWRYHEGALYLPYKPWSRQTEMSPAGSDYFPSERDANWGGRYPDRRTPTLDEAYKNLEASLGSFLIIDGIVWQRSTAEPCYDARGTGWSNPRPSIWIGTVAATAADQWTIFNALEREQAIESALAQSANPSKEAEFRAYLESSPVIEVLIPEAVKYHPDRDSAKGQADIAYFECSNERYTRKAFEVAASKMDPASVGRGETGYAEYLEHAAAALIAEAERFRVEGDEFDTFR